MSNDKITQRKNINVLSPNPASKTHQALVNAFDSALPGKGNDIVKTLFAEKEENGEFEDFNELQERVHGVGPATIEKIKSMGYVCKMEELGAGLVDESLDEQLDLIWEASGKKDKYTNEEIAEDEVLTMVSDHIIDYSLTSLAWKEAVTSVGQVKETRQANRLMAQVKGLLNDPELNVNLTDTEVKDIKNSPFKNYSQKRELQARITKATIPDAYMRAQHGDFVENGHWDTTKKAVVESWDKAQENEIFQGKLNGRRIGGTAETIASKVLESLTEQLDELKIAA